jgi:hypothetical protein
MTALEIEAKLSATASQIEALKAEKLVLECALRRQRDIEEDRARRVEHERTRTILEDSGGDIVACASAVTSREGVRGYFVGVGRNGKLLAAWEVVEYRSRKAATLVRGSARVPDVVELAVFQTYGLTKTHG